MRTRFLSIAILGLVLANAAHAASVLTGPIFNPATGHDYYLLTESTWTDAQTFAQTLGGNLVTINDAAENDWVYQTFGERRNLWIGLNDQQTEGTYTWISGETPAYTNWRLGQPDNFAPVGGENFVHIYGSHTNFGGQWNDAANDSSVYSSFAFFPEVVPLHGVVEVAAVPLPSSLTAGLTLGVALLLTRSLRRRLA